MKRLCVFAGALLFLSGSWLWAEGPAILEKPTAPILSSGTPPGEPFVWPVSTMIGGRRIKIVSKFGRRKVPAIPDLDTSTVAVPAEEMHEGLDFGVPAESTVRAARSGKVLFAGFSGAYVSRKDKKDKNHLVIMRHPDGLSTRYVHLNRLMVRPGQDVKAGDILGTSSESDEWTEPVVHFEIRDPYGKALDPMPFLPVPEKGTLR